LGGGRAALRSVRTQLVLLGVGVVAAVVGYGAGALLQELFRPAPDSFGELLVSTQPHTDSAVEMVGNTGVAVAVAALCLLATRVPVPRVLLTPLSASGALSWTGSSLPIVYIRVRGRDAA